MLRQEPLMLLDMNSQDLSTRRFSNDNVQHGRWLFVWLLSFNLGNPVRSDCQEGTFQEEIGKQEDPGEMAEYKIVRLTAEHLPGATDVLRQSFFPDEKFCSCVRILQDSDEIRTDSKYKVTKGSKELEDLGFDAVKDGISFCALDIRTGEVLGVALNKIQVKPKPGELCYLEQYAKKHIRDPSAQAFVDAMIDVDSRYNLFGDDGDSYFEVLYLSVKSTNKGKGIGTALVTASAKLGQDMRLKNTNRDPSVDVKSEAKEYKNSKALDMSPKCVSAIFTSRFSQRCGRRAGYEEVLVVPYTELKYKGRPYSDVTGPDHPHCTLSVKFLA